MKSRMQCCCTNSQYPGVNVVNNEENDSNDKNAESLGIASPRHDVDAGNGQWVNKLLSTMMYRPLDTQRAQLS